MGSTQALAVLLHKDVVSRHKIRQYVEFLLGDKPRPYPYLTDFLEWYGLRYLLPVIRNIILANDLELDTAIELGPGTGWLVNSIEDLGFETRIGIDKRVALYSSRRDVRFINWDLETPYGMKMFEELADSRSLIIANHFLHCIDFPSQLVYAARDSMWLVIEPTGVLVDGPFPYWGDQMLLFGAKPLNEEELKEVFESSHFRLVDWRDIPGQKITLWRRA